MKIVLPSMRSYETRAVKFTLQTYLIVFLFCYANDARSKLASKKEFVNLWGPVFSKRGLKLRARGCLVKFSSAGEIDGIMWIGVRSAFVLLCFCSILLPVLTNEAFFGKNSPVKAGRCLMQGSESPEHVRSRYKVLMVNFFDRRARLLRRKSIRWWVCWVYR